jgi:uncharacterized damage-inducible protein DinB
MDIAELIRYNHAVRQQYLEALEKLPWAEVIKIRGLSFDSARDVFLHLTLVEDRWINYIIPGKFSEWKDIEFDRFHGIKALGDYTEKTKGCTDKFLKNLKQADLNRKIDFPWGKPGTQISLENALTHLVMEDMVHYGELSAMMWQMGLEAPYLAFARFALSRS